MDPYGTHQPFLAHYVSKTKGDVAEFGSGKNSTGMLRELLQGSGRRLVTYENSMQWLDEMRAAYPENELHTYVPVDDWQATLSSIPKDAYSVVFVDQAPWEARVWTLRHFKDHADYIVLHDSDYFPKNNIFGKVLSERVFDHSDDFSKFHTYFPSEPWPAPTGPPTLVGTNKEGCVIDPDI